MQNENYPIVTIDMWICTVGRAAGRTGAAESAVVALQNMYFTLSVVLIYSIYYDFWDKAVFGLLFTNWNVALQIPHKLQSNIVL